VEAARLETLSGNYLPNLALVVNGQPKVVTDSVYHRIQNSVVWISTGYASTPAIYVSSYLGNVGMGTAVNDPNWRLTVEGNLRISTTSSPGKSYGIMFADGTMLTSAGNIGSASSISSNGDAIIQAGADPSKSANVVLRSGSLDGLLLNSGGNVGIGTVNPISRLNVRGGDLVLGAPVNPYSSNGVEDLIVAGSIVFDGDLVQRSMSTIQLSNLVVAGNVYLSTAPGAMTGIGNVAPGYNLDVTGNINASGSVYTGGTARISNTGTIGLGVANATWDGSIIDVPHGGTGAGTLASGGILYGKGTAAVGVLPVLPVGQLLIGNGAGVPTEAGLTGTPKQITVTGAAAGGVGSITLSLPQNLDTAADITFNSLALAAPLALASGGTGINAAVQGDLLYYNAGTALSRLAKDASATRYLSNTGTNNDPAWAQVNMANGVTGLLATLNGGTGANLSAATIGAVPYFSAPGVMSALGAGAATYLLQGNGGAAPDWVQSTNANTANTVVRRDASGSFSGNVITANSFSGTIAGGSSYIQDTVAGNDYIRVKGFSAGAPGGNDGYLELATADDGNEPVYVRQYTGLFGAISHQATLLDGNGDATFPRYLNAVYFNMVADTQTVNPSYIVGGYGADGYLRWVAPANVTVGKATALAANAGNCASGSFARGVDASGAAENCETNISGNAANVTGVVALANGGTGAAAANPAAARAALGAAASGANSDITSLTGAGLKLGIGYGGTGSTSIGAGFVKSNGTVLSNVASINLAGADVSGTLDIGSGGTNATTFTASRVIRMNAGGTALESVPGGLSNSYTVARTTTTTGTPCNSWTFTNGVLTTIGPDIVCP